MNKDLGQYEEFALMVRAIVGERSLRAVNVRTGVGHTTILNMTNGLRPKATTIRLFAEGMGVDPNPLLEAAGYPPLPTRQAPDTKAHGSEDGADIAPPVITSRADFSSRVSKLTDAQRRIIEDLLDSWTEGAVS